MNEDNKLSDSITYILATELYLKPLLENNTIDYETFYQAGNALFDRLQIQSIQNLYRPIKRQKNLKQHYNIASRYPEYISLTEIARKYSSLSPNQVISGWLNKNQTKEFIELWQRKAENTDKEAVVTQKGNKGGTYTAYEIACYFMLCHSPSFSMHLIESACLSEETLYE